MSHGWQPYGKVPKHEKEAKRAQRRQEKAERLAYRRAIRIGQVPIDDLPSDYQGLARTLANGGDHR